MSQIAAVNEIITNDQGEKTEYWFLTDDVDKILDCEKVIYVNSVEELYQELEVMYYEDEGLTKVEKSSLSYSHALNNKIKDKILDVEKEYNKSIKGYHNNNSKPVFKISEHPFALTKDLFKLTELAKKHGKIKPPSGHSYYSMDGITHVGHSVYIGDDLAIADGGYITYAPGARAKHEKKLEHSRIKKMKSAGNIPYGELLHPLHEIVKADLHRVITNTIGKKIAGPYCLVLNYPHKTELNKKVVLMGLIADGIQTIKNLSKERLYRKASHQVWVAKSGLVNLEFKTFLEQVKPSIDFLLQSEKEVEKNFGTVMAEEIKALKI